MRAVDLQYFSSVIKWQMRTAKIIRYSPFEANDICTPLMLWMGDGVRHPVESLQQRRRDVGVGLWYCLFRWQSVKEHCLEMTIFQSIPITSSRTILIKWMFYLTGAVAWAGAQLLLLGKCPDMRSVPWGAFLHSQMILLLLRKIITLGRQSLIVDIINWQ